MVEIRAPSLLILVLYGISVIIKNISVAVSSAENLIDMSYLTSEVSGSGCKLTDAQIPVKSIRNHNSNSHISNVTMINTTPTRVKTFPPPSVNGLYVQFAHSVSLPSGFPI